MMLSARYSYTFGVDVSVHPQVGLSDKLTAYLRFFIDPRIQKMPIGSYRN